MAIGVPLSAIRLGRAAESKMKQDAAKGKGSAADNSGARVKFSAAEEAALRKGYAKHGHLNDKWAQILRDPEFAGVFNAKRSGVNLKDK